MRFLPLLLGNLLRRKLRTALATGSFAVALFLFCLLATINAAFGTGHEPAGTERLFVTHRVSITRPLLVAQRERIARVEGVASVTHLAWFGGVYQDEKNFFPQLAVDGATWRSVYDEYEVDPREWQAFLADRMGAIAGRATAERFGWKVGDRVVLKGARYPGDWAFNLRGLYTGRSDDADLTQFWFRWEYYKEKAPATHTGLVSWYIVRVRSGHDPGAVAARIDSLFENSAWETLTQPESAVLGALVQQLGNVEQALLAVGGVVFCTLLLVTGNTLALSVRERTGEIAVLKTIGFRDGAILGLVLAESLAVAVGGGALGIAAAKLFTLRGDPTQGMLLFASFHLSGASMAGGAGLALLAGLLAGLLPALEAMRLPVVSALRRL